jgi:hypothetical protein
MYYSSSYPYFPIQCMTDSFMFTMPTYTIGSISKTKCFCFISMDPGGSSAQPVASRRERRHRPTHITLPQVNSDPSQYTRPTRRARMNSSTQ